MGGNLPRYAQLGLAKPKPICRICRIVGHRGPEDRASTTLEPQCADHPASHALHQTHSSPMLSVMFLSSFFRLGQ